MRTNSAAQVFPLNSSQTRPLRLSAARLLIYAIMIGLVLLILVPLWWMVSTSLKPQSVHPEDAAGPDPEPAELRELRDAGAAGRSGAHVLQQPVRGRGEHSGASAGRVDGGLRFCADAVARAERRLSAVSGDDDDPLGGAGDPAVHPRFGCSVGRTPTGR